MNHSAPHFRLFSESNAEDQPGRWRFRLQLKQNDGQFSEESSHSQAFEAGGTEPDVRGERLELLCVVRGLEALDQPSRVTLITDSAYVREGIRYGLEQWRANGWRWESFGRMVPVKNQDLWQRVDAAMKFHRLECQMWRFDEPHDEIPSPKLRESKQTRPSTAPCPVPRDGIEVDTLLARNAETALTVSVNPERTETASRQDNITRNNLIGYAIIRCLAGIRARILAGAAQVGRVVGV